MPDTSSVKRGAVQAIQEYMRENGLGDALKKYMSQNPKSKDSTDETYVGERPGGEMKVGRDWLGWAQFGLAVVIMIGGFAITVNILKVEMRHLGEDVERLTTDVSQLTRTVARIEEWRTNIGSVPSSREIDDMKERVDALRNEVSRMDERTRDIVDRAIHELKTNVTTPQGNYLNRIGYYVHEHEADGKPKPVSVVGLPKGDSND